MRHWISLSLPSLDKEDLLYNSSRFLQDLVEDRNKMEDMEERQRSSHCDPAMPNIYISRHSCNIKRERKKASEQKRRQSNNLHLIYGGDKEEEEEEE